MDPLRAEYIIIEEAARILQDIKEVLPESQSIALSHLSREGGEKKAEADKGFRHAARLALIKELIEFLDFELNPPTTPRPRLVRQDESAGALRLTYQRLLAVLCEWDAYTYLELSEASRGIPISTIASRLESGGQVYPGSADAVAVRLSDLAGLLWKSLEAGPEEVDRIHDEFYAEEQAQHFKMTYKSPEHVAETLDGMYEPLLSPAEMFMRLGRPAQMIIVREGLLQQAVENYERGVRLNKEKEKTERLESKRLSEARRKVSEAVKKMRELDKSQCVFCGKKLVSHLKYVLLDEGIYQVLKRSYGEPDSKRFDPKYVVLACSSCASQLSVTPPVDIDIIPKFGRFSRDNK